MYRKFEPEQSDDMNMEQQQPEMYDTMDYEDRQQMGGRPMYCYPMMYDDYATDEYGQPEEDEGYGNQQMNNWWGPGMSRQYGNYNMPRPRRRRRRRRRPFQFYFTIPPFYNPYYHNPYNNYYHDYDHDHDYYDDDDWDWD